MYRLVECLTQEHSLWLVAIAALVCIVGSCLSVRLAVRLVQASPRRKMVHLALTSLIAGATIWSTHFIAMLAYDPGFNHAYEPSLTGLSLFVAIFGVMASNTVLAYTSRRSYALLSGTLFGLTVSAMHYLGMEAYQLPGHII